MAVGGYPGPGLMTHLKTLRPHHLELAQRWASRTRMSQNLLSIERILIYIENIIFRILITLLPRLRSASLLNHLFNFHQLPTSTSPPSRAQATTKADRSLPLRGSLCPPEALPDSRRSSRCPDARGPADLLAPSGPCDGAPPPAGWVVVRWALCCDPQLV